MGSDFVFAEMSKTAVVFFSILLLIIASFGIIHNFSKTVKDNGGKVYARGVTHSEIVNASYYLGEGPILSSNPSFFVLNSNLGQLSVKVNYYNDNPECAISSVFVYDKNGNKVSTDIINPDLGTCLNSGSEREHHVRFSVPEMRIVIMLDYVYYPSQGKVVGQYSIVRES